MDIGDRVTGCLLGLAVGDALGAPFRSRRATDVPHPVPALVLPWSGGPPGSTTDGTAMARNLARSLVARNGFDPEDLVARHLAWLRTDPPRVGMLTRRVLVRAEAGERAEDVARAMWEERGPEVSAGNGSVMYCAPLGAAYANRPDLLSDLAPALSALTHFDERCRTAVLAVTVATAALVRGVGAGPALDLALRATRDRAGGEELEFLTGAVGAVRPIDGPDRSFCLFAAAAGFQTLSRDDDVEPGLRRIVAMGGDTDTNAAVGGALLGALRGRIGLPSTWLERLADHQAIETEAGGLVPLSSRG